MEVCFLYGLDDLSVFYLSFYKIVRKKLLNLRKSIAYFIFS